MANQRFSPQELIPKYWHGIYVTSDEDVAFLGKATIGQMVRYWRGEERDFSSTIRKLQQRIDLLSGKTVEQIKQIASGYEMPEFPKIGKRADNWSGELEPLDVDSTSRKPEATTFNVCGWCKFSGGGSCRYSYHISTNCLLIPEQLDNQYDSKKFNTPCAITNGDQYLLDTIVKYLETEKLEAISSKGHVSAMIRRLVAIGKSTENKPTFANNRPHDWFNIGDRVVAILDFDGIIVQDKIVHGKVVNGYRHHDGWVSVRANVRVHNNTDNIGGHGLSCGISRPEIMHEWEFEYLLGHPDFTKLWLRAIESSYAKYDKNIIRHALNL